MHRKAAKLRTGPILYDILCLPLNPDLSNAIT